MNNTINYAVDSDGIALLTIDLPGMSMNVLTPELMADLAEGRARVAALPFVSLPGAERGSEPGPDAGSERA